MISCPGCGAGMRFDIASQKLKCDYCGAEAVVGEIAGGSEAREQKGVWSDTDFQETNEAGTAAESGADGAELMDVTIFSCPQCGGEIYSTGQEASSFCTFCGASVVLEGRLSQAVRPKYIIPFKKTKEDCKKIYADLTSGTVFTPKELKDPEYLERFQGIYLPFWTYSFSQKGNVVLKGTRESGDYTEHLSLSCDLDATYDGISYDASSAFNDELCSYITPFNRSSVKNFDPGYMSGFYADAADVDSDIYVEDAQKDADDETFKKIKKQYPDVTVSPPKNPGKAFHTSFEGVTAAMYPVWFLTYRSGDRVAYAVVNGETGQIAADLPADRKKFVLGSLLLALPLFLLYTLLPTITAQRQMIIAIIFAAATFLIYLLGSWEIERREFRTDDKGFQSSLKKSKRKKSGSRKSAKGPGKTDNKVRSAGTGAGENRFMVAFRTFLPLLAAVAGIIIRVVNPVSDIYYYGGTILIFICICFTLMGTIKRFNLLTTRPIPKFHDREGGDSRA